MTTEEKAKAYDDALEKVKGLFNSPRTCFDIDQLTDIFPELHDSEDEKIRKFLIKLVNDGFTHFPDNITRSGVLVYLEKQKEATCFSELMNKLTATEQEVMFNGWSKEEKEQKPNFDTHWENGSMVCEQKEEKVEWKPQPESLEALMYAIDGKWDMISPTSYLSRRLEDLYEGLVNTYNVDESLLDELPKVASRTYTAEDIEELKELKKKIDASMEQKLADEAKDFFDSAKSYGDRELPQLAKVKATGKIVNIINGTLSTEENRWIAYSSDKEDGYKIYRPDQLFFLDTESKSEDRFKEAREKYQVEWSEEDERMLKSTIWHISNSLTNGKNTDCKCDLTEWLKEKLKSLRPSWKPSEQEKGALRTAIHILTDERSFPKAAAQLQNILDAFEGKESRKDWKPSEEQMKMLAMFLNLRCVSRQEAATLESLYNDLKKLM